MLVVVPPWSTRQSYRSLVLITVKERRLIVSGTIVLVIAGTGLVLTVLACLLGAYIVYKLRQVHETLYATDFIVRTLSRDVTQTLQTADQLRHEFKFDQPLPPLRGWAASPDVLLLIARHVRHAGPAVIVECGSGSSTLVLAQAAKLNGHGHVYSIDHDGAFAEETRNLLDRHGLSEWATVCHAPLRETEIAGTRWTWYDIECLPRTPLIDLLFIDGPPAGDPSPWARYPAGPILFPHLAAEGIVFADDTARPGETAVLQRWTREFPHLRQYTHFCEKGCCELRMPAESKKPATIVNPTTSRPGDDRKTAVSAV